MKIQQILLGAATVMLLTTSPVWADDEANRPSRSNHSSPIEHSDRDKPKPGRGYARAPEIDAASGTSAIVLLTGALLLAGERSRSRRC
ncbi:MAG: VPEID-CTERM sorting domain-containing protein [Methylobacter sp.]|uniref:VPEID-CTERM sorting domain-containing protein n=1 Tax=Methylobacter sp. TaxID=2051955 RepID=UPI0025FA7052|nr:VPEID-CTERM sorting domain-containing protein [Methylobacter sp.]MCK9620207.1 VPEID-CTERM sorting domain-containing protein [Methylobacter sp.]